MSLRHLSAEIATTATAKSRSWRSILLLAISAYLPLALAMAVMTYSLLKVDVDARLQKLQAQEVAEVSVAEQLLLSDLEYAASDLQFLAQIPSLKHYVNDASPVEKQRVTEHFINMVQTRQRYDQIRYLDHSGMEKIRVNLVNNRTVIAPETALQNKAARYYFRDSLRLAAKEIYTSPMDLNIEHGMIEFPYKPTMRFGTPILNRDGKKQGVLIINYFGQKLLNDFALVMGAKRHTMLLNHEGYWLHSAEPELEWGFMFGREDTFGKYHPDAWRGISASEQGSMLTQDGLYTFATVRPVFSKIDTQVPERNNAGKKSANSTSLEAYMFKIVSLVTPAELPALSPSQYPRSFSLFFFSLILLALLSVYLADSLLGRRQLRAAVFESEAQLKQAQRLTQMGSWELNFSSGELTWSDEIYRIFEIEPGRFGASYEAFLNIIHPQDQERVNLFFNESVQQHKPYCTEHRLQLANGRIKHVLERGETIYDAHDRPLRAIGTVQDITARKQTEEGLRNSKETARALLNATTESAILIDAAGTVLVINKTASKRLNKRVDEILNHNIYELFPVEIAASRKNLVEKVVLSGEPGQFQDEHDGIHLAHSLYPVFDEQDRVSQIAIYSTDITEHLKLQSEETLLHHIDQQLLRNTPLPGLLQFICDEIVHMFAYQFAWVGQKETNGRVIISAQSDDASGYLQALQRIGVRWDETSQGRGPTGSCIRSGQIEVFKISDSSFQPWHDAAAHTGFQSIAGIPLVVRGQMYGALTLYSKLEHVFDDSVTLKRLSGIASRICVTLEMAMDQEQLRLLSTALASTGNGVFITDASGKIIWINHSFTRLTGYSSDEAIGQPPSLLKSGKQDADYYKILWQTIQRGNTWSNETVERHKSGALFTVQQTITPIKNDAGTVSHFVSILDDITAQKETAARIQHMAHFDALTDLPNRALFRDRLQQMLLQAKRDSQSCALMFLDLDRFKSVNDTLGHHIGDLLLQAVAERIKACVRETDTVSRLAGDEFTVLLPHVRGHEDAALIAAKITASLAAPFTLDGHAVNIGSSTGIASYPADADSEEALIKCADQAMYQAKEQGRGTYRFYQAAD